MEQVHDYIPSTRTPPQHEALGWFQVARRVYILVWLFVTMLVQIGWTAAWLKNQPPTPDTEAKWNLLYRSQAVRFRKTADKLGGLVIKVGQFLSSRVDFLPKAFIDEIQTLQDSVLPAPWDRVRPELEQELGPISQNFLSFSPKPLASASLGQVYEAYLHSGERVAVKIQRPQIESIVEADLRALGIIVAITTRFTQFGRTFDLGTVLREFRRSIYEELDYTHELANTEAIREELQDISYVHVPLTYQALSTQHVLTMEFWDGIKINQIDALTAHGISPSLVAERAIRLYLYMVMDVGLYHADPHPGNMLVDPQGSIVLLDYGMVGSIDPITKRHIRHLFVAISEHNAGALVESLDGLGMILPDANRAHLKRQVTYLLDRYYAETLDQLRGLDIPSLLRDFENLLRNQAIQVPGEFAFLGRAIAILVGLATELDPQINLVELFAPYAKRFVTEDHGGTLGYAQKRVQRWGQTVLTLPELSDRVLRQVEAGDLEAKIHWDQGSHLIRRLVRSMHSLTQSIYVIGFVLAGTLLLINKFPIYAKIAFTLAILSFLLGMVRRNR
ncbi:MAG: ABC transporter [Sulfobacillus benefaciens]|uniref:ABC transporter n=1 Tax=Sulfobacillus benefaciens TaxID=453960 RepID=A0A2T2XFI6_9FIRM|nr:MAG: ABC transporter [Sulfobacillus benefaciens]